MLIEQKFKINNVKKEAQHETEFVISKSKYQLTTIVSVSKYRVISYKLIFSIIESS